MGMNLVMSKGGARLASLGEGHRWRFQPGL